MSSQRTERTGGSWWGPLSWWTAALALLAGLVGAAHAPAAARTVRVGRGGYTLAAPPGMKLPPRAIYRTRSVTGAMPTNDWWSSLAWQRFSSNHFPYPLAVRATAGGLRVSYPGASIRATAKHIIAGMQDELVLGHSGSEAFPDARVDGFGDWSVSVLFADGARRMRVTYGHGSPFVYALFDGGGASIRFDAPPKVWPGTESAATLGVSVKGRHYGLFGPAGSTWGGLGGTAFVNDLRGKRHFSLAVLPDDRPETLRLFERYAHSHVVDTRVEWRYVPAASTVETTFAFSTKPYEGTERRALFALYPHQWLATKHKLLPYTYASIRGPMKLGAGTGFATTMRFPGVLPALPPLQEGSGEGTYDRKRLARYVEEAARKPFKDPPDTYWQGKVLGTMTNLIPVAEQAGRTEEAGRLRETLRSRLERWLAVPTDGGGARCFVYDKTWGTLIGHRSSFGSSKSLNDHHFHYGYFVRAAAELARTDPAWAADDAWGGMVKLLIRDIAGGDRRDALFPYLRCFDPYAGHSWASGSARFGDGNNQESCSEAMNAWTGIVLWGAMTGETRLRDLGIYLYTTELHAINSYWFDVEDRFFPERYEQTCAALVWGGKTDYATWFSGEPEHVHGIVLLPIQSGSLYLGLYPKYVRRNLQGLARLRGGDRWKHWHEILWMYEALSDGEAAMRRFEAGAERIDPHARPYACHWIGGLEAMGHLDASVAADSALYAVFRKGGRRTYVVYNTQGKPRTVTFSDGFRLRARGEGFVVAQETVK